jgi:hypothetical protein
MTSVRLVVAFSVFLAGISLQDATEIPLGIDARDRVLVEASIREAFPSITGWTLSTAFVSAFSAGGIDRRVHVDVPTTRATGRVARHVRFACERREQTGAWSCGGSWQRLWQVDRPAGQCAAPLMGLDASRVSEE